LTSHQAIARFKTELERSKGREAVKALRTSRKIHDLVFMPLKNALGDVKEIFISPDGNLNLIPFEVLQGPDGRFLIEDYIFNYLAAGRDILGFGQKEASGSKALIIGDPDFDLETDEKSDTLRKLSLAQPEDATKRSVDMRGFHFSSLPGTREEVDAIGAILNNQACEVYTGKQALEEVLRQTETPRILHLATHGFFLEDLDLSDLVDQRGLQMASMGSFQKGASIKVENPLLRSGIALAGANNALDSENVGNSDGIVTAEKILGLRLRGTDMVVLSACETGLGEVKAGEGVYGLRRAFLQAGAKSLVMSMWSVPDKETKELMVQFYKNIQSGKMNRCQSLRQAMLSEMQKTRERYDNANPFYWGAFVFLGEP